MNYVDDLRKKLAELEAKRQAKVEEIILETNLKKHELEREWAPAIAREKEWRAAGCPPAKQFFADVFDVETGELVKAPPAPGGSEASPPPASPQQKPRRI